VRPPQTVPLSAWSAELWASDVCRPHGLRGIDFDAPASRKVILAGMAAAVAAAAYVRGRQGKRVVESVDALPR